MRLITAAAMFAALTVSAVAQTPAPAQKTTLEFDPQQLQWLAQAINELPKKIADPFLAELNKQIAEREKAKAEAAEKAKPKPEPENK